VNAKAYTRRINRPKRLDRKRMQRGSLRASIDFRFQRRQAKLWKRDPLAPTQNKWLHQTFPGSHKSVADDVYICRWFSRRGVLTLCSNSL
jgi:hypothetical protein